MELWGVGCVCFAIDVIGEVEAGFTVSRFSARDFHWVLPWNVVERRGTV